MDEEFWIFYTEDLLDLIWKKKKTHRSIVKRREGHVNGVRYKYHINQDENVRFRDDVTFEVLLLIWSKQKIKEYPTSYNGSSTIHDTWKNNQTVNR